MTTAGLDEQPLEAPPAIGDREKERWGRRSLLTTLGGFIVAVAYGGLRARSAYADNWCCIGSNACPNCDSFSSCTTKGCTARRGECPVPYPGNYNQCWPCSGFGGMYLCCDWWLNGGRCNCVSKI
jgi:hypothetical protein